MNLKLIRFGHPASSEGGEALKDGIGQCRTPGSVEAQLNCTCYLIDVLSTGALSTDSRHLNFRHGHAELSGDFKMVHDTS